jgi:hypothetical protein
MLIRGGIVYNKHGYNNHQDKNIIGRISFMFFEGGLLCIKKGFN